MSERERAFRSISIFIIYLFIFGMLADCKKEKAAEDKRDELNYFG